MIRAAFIALCLASPLIANVWPSFGPGHAQYAVGGATSISPSFTARKIQGSTCLAPCAVHFDAIGMGALSASPYVTTETTDSVFNREFHSLHFEWDFDDPNSGTWSTGAAAATGTPQPKNYDIGGIAGHLYENPGTYTVTLTVTNPAGESAQTTREVVVGDRTTYFSAADTFCFANDDSNWTGCPLDCAGGDDNCTVLTSTTTAPNLLTALEGGDNCSGADDCAGFTTQQRRILFKRGGTYVLPTPGTADPNPGTTPGFIEAFGSGAKPIFDLSGQVLESGVGWTFADLAIEDCATSCILGTVDDFRATYVRVEATYKTACWDNNNGLPVFPPDYQPADYDEWPYLWALFDVDCTGTPDQSNFGAWPASNYLLWMGGTHNHAPTGSTAGATTVRSRHMQHALIAHRTFLNPTPGRENFHFRNWDLVAPWTTCGTVDECAGRFVLVADNFMEESSSGINFTVRVCVDAGCNCGEGACGANTDGTIVDVRDFIFERNFHHWPEGTPTTHNGIYELQGGDFTVRNNVYDLQGSGWSTVTLAMATGEPTAKLDGTTTTGNVHVYNNTLYFTEAVSNDLWLGNERSTGTGCGTPTPVGCRSYNNLVVAPNFTGVLAWDAAFTHSGDMEIQTPNPFIGAVPARGSTAIDDFALAAASAPIGAGYDFNSGTDTDRWVYDDAMRLCRPGNADGWDVGAHEYGASACY